MAHEVDVSNIEEINTSLTIKEIVAGDMRKYAEEMKITERQLIKDFAKNTNVVLRTLERIFESNKKFTPHVRTIVDIYSQIYDANSLAEIISKAPPIVSDFIKKNHTQFAVGDSKVSDVTSNSAVQASLTSSSIFNQIYIMTSGDYGTDLAAIRENFGINGLKHLDEMIKLGFVEIEENDQIRRKKKLTWDKKIRNNFMKTLITDVYKEENSDMAQSNYLGFAVGDVTPMDYDIIRNIIKVNADQILTIINNSKPSYDEAVRVAVGKVMEKVEFKIEGDKLC